MNNLDINSMKEFRRFANTYIYPKTAHVLMCNIKDVCDGNDILYSQLPQTTIKFHTDITTQGDLTVFLYGLLRGVFINFFNTPDIVSFIRNQIHSEIQDEELKKILRSSLQEIQHGNSQYLGLLFNITCLADNYVYLYL